MDAQLVQTLEFTQNSNIPISELFIGFSKAFHKILFQDIFSNSGRFRSGADPNQGKVYFGPHHDRRRNLKFSGSNPASIQADLAKAAQLLSYDDDDPILNSVSFYQRFVYIHPFYDANGRIGRLLVSIYLRFHGYVVLWKPLENEQKRSFISKLNKCHNQTDKPSFDHKIRDLYKFWQSYVKSESDLEGNE